MAPPPDQLSYFFTAVAPQADWFRGEDGYHYDLKISPSDEGRLSQTGYVAYRIQHRRDEFSLLLRSGRLFQQYLVGMWAAADQNRLSYLCRHQSDIRATQVDIVLATFLGSVPPAYMAQTVNGKWKAGISFDNKPTPTKKPNANA